jgi:hypothetical protein
MTAAVTVAVAAAMTVAVAVALALLKCTTILKVSSFFSRNETAYVEQLSTD